MNIAYTRPDRQYSGSSSCTGKDIVLVIPTPQLRPSRRLAANNPFLDFSVNAMALMSLLEATRRSCAEAGLRLHFHE